MSTPCSAFAARAKETALLPGRLSDELTLAEHPFPATYSACIRIGIVLIMNTSRCVQRTSPPRGTQPPPASRCRGRNSNRRCHCSDRSRAAPGANFRGVQRRLCNTIVTKIYSTTHGVCGRQR